MALSVAAPAHTRAAVTATTAPADKAGDECPPCLPAPCALPPPLYGANTIHGQTLCPAARRAARVRGGPLSARPPRPAEASIYRGRGCVTSPPAQTRAPRPRRNCSEPSVTSVRSSAFKTLTEERVRLAHRGLPFGISVNNDTGRGCPRRTGAVARAGGRPNPYYDTAEAYPADDFGGLFVFVEGPEQL
ncbi:hypothetical protein EVAR_50205_1 [Eumeta japonica]|uniref:Uncharacterized protein n=1 Tax=Eumeta variegata TaxID=151549 RepID=A0A4C1X0C4_EUMVA|nr:hypothetical protein EVAR_50205_1 [Eumeta japonica]